MYTVINNFSEWLLNELERRDWSQAELARRSGVSTGAISHVLAGTRSPGTELCRAIADAFGIPFETVYRAAGLLPQQSRLDDLQQELVYITNDLPEADMEEIIAFVNMKKSLRKKGRKSQVSEKL